MNSERIYLISLRGLPSERVTIQKCTYDNGRVALLLVCENGEPYDKATVNLPDVPMEPDEVAIRDYSEGTGMLDFLIANDVVYPPHNFAQSGYILAPICRLKGEFSGR